MKLLIAFVAAVCIVGVYSHHEPMTDEQKAKIHADVESCIAESKVDKQLLEEMKLGNKVTPTEELNCFAECMFKKKGDMNDDGTFVDKASDSEAVKECKKLKSTEKCGTAGKVMGCFIEKNLIPKIKNNN